MSLPIEIQRLCDQYLTAIRADPQHEFSLIDRLNLYRSFYPGQYNQPVDTNTVSFNPFAEQGPVKVTLPDHAMGWLGVLAARKVAPLWERALEQAGLNRDDTVSPEEVLQVCEDCLWSRITLRKALELSSGDIHLGGNIKDETTYEAAHVYPAAYDALICIGTNHSNLKEVLTNEKLAYKYHYDIAKTALAAFAVVDKNPPGLWSDIGVDDRGIYDEVYELLKPLLPKEDCMSEVPHMERFRNYAQEYAEKLKNFIPLEYDIQKRLEFWEWWLGEAVPQAWELGEQSWSGVVRQV